MLRKNRPSYFFAIAAIGAFVGGATAQQSSDLDVNWHIEDVLRAGNVLIDDVEILTRGMMLEAYERTGFESIWIRQERIDELLALIQDSSNHGLLTTDYNLAEVETARGELLDPATGSRRRAEADILLTESLLRYGYHRRYGKVEANRLDPNINFRRETFRNRASAENIEQAIRSASLIDFVELIAPTGPIYRQLQHALISHRNLAAAGGWPTVSAGPTLRPGDDGPRVAELRARLAASGDLLATANSDAQSFDAALESAVIIFQQRHSLAPDGVVGAQTIAAMNIPVEARIDQLRLSLERLRWVNDEPTDTMIAVNIAGFRAFYVENGEILWHTRAMVGTDYRETPVFKGDIAYLEFNPTWTIPPGILRNDTLPAVKRDPNYLASRNIRVIDRDGQFVDPSTVDWNRYNTTIPYTLRQDAGPSNALGVVKFIFPNEHFVFLHDTPNRSLFAEPQRAFSSGCIRVEHPLTLAELVLNDSENFSLTKLQSIVASRETQRIFPTANVSVLIVYLTASIDPDGFIRYYDDIYGRDKAVLDALDGPVTFNAPDA